MNPLPPIIQLSARKSRPGSSPSVKDMIIITVAVGLLAAIAVPSFTTARLRARASTVLSANMRQVDAAKDQYMLENNKDKSVTPTWADLTPYLKAGSRLVTSGGKDNFDNPIIIGTLGENPRINPKTKNFLKEVCDNEFWGPFS